MVLVQLFFDNYLATRINDVFFVRLENAVSIDLVIVSRWGNFMACISGLSGYWTGLDGTI
ncbi:hypothetical protein [Fluviicola sp.]|jgi:hypothetical protein|uniref:hypothetical protein n=1 Tax=Fluviicola sp. TaxID=1917219 RepID=UPI00281CB70C|nr:hypothetical protein [Fluviicola sp.]MDR0802071.1 hypothetical protein [Fluviicola sp.]